MNTNKNKNKSAVTVGKFSNDEAEVRIGGVVVGVVSRDYVTLTTGAEALGSYDFEPYDEGEALGLDGIPSVAACSWEGYRIRSAADALRMLRERIAAELAR